MKVCVPCNCDETGSRSLQCDDDGQCPCKPGVGGQHCDRCEAGFYDFSPQGCKYVTLRSARFSRCLEKATTIVQELPLFGGGQ